MGNSSSSQSGPQSRSASGARSPASRRTESPHRGRTGSPLTPHRSLRTKKKSLELPDLASLGFGLTPTHSAHSSPQRRGANGARISSPIPIPVTPGTAASTQQRRPELPSTTAMPDVLLHPPSTHIPVHATGGRPRSRHMRGAPLPYSSTRSFAVNGTQQPRSPLGRRDDASEFREDVVRSSIPLALLKAVEGEEGVRGRRPAVDEPQSAVVTYKGGTAKSVVLARAGDHNWKGRQPMERQGDSDQWSTTVHVLPGTHHLKFIVDDTWRVDDEMPTAVDDNGSLANYIQVPSPKPPQGAVNERTQSPVTPARANANNLHAGISFWSQDDSESTSSAGGVGPSGGPRDGAWSDVLPPALIAAAREEEEFLASQEAAEEEESFQGPRGNNVPAPNVPAAPPLPRFLEKLILNTRPGVANVARATGAEPRRSSTKDKSTRHASAPNGDEHSHSNHNGHGQPSQSPLQAIPVTTASGTDVTQTLGPALQFTAPSTPEPGTKRDRAHTRLDSGQAAVAAALADDASVLPVPNHVVLHHLSTSAIKNGVLAVANTTRYRKKYLTTIYYKPT